MLNQSLRYHNLTNFEWVKLANYFLHLMFADPVFGGTTTPSVSVVGTDNQKLGKINYCLK